MSDNSQPDPSAPPPPSQENTTETTALGSPPARKLQPDPVLQPEEKPWWKKILGPLFFGVMLVVKFFSKIKFFILPALKYLPILLKTGGSMILSIGVYGMLWGWPFAVGFVLLIFIHEIGHVLAARWMKLKVSAPVFIPFIGAHILLKEMPPNAKIEAIVGIGGPIFGTVGAVLCHMVYAFTHDPFWLALAYSGYFLNLFNLIPLTPLDGGRICAALSPWLWLPGLAILVAMMFQRQSINPVFILILIGAVPKLWQLFSAKSDEEKRYFEVEPAHRIIIAISYFGLAGLLFFLKENAMETLQGMGHWHH